MASTTTFYYANGNSETLSNADDDHPSITLYGTKDGNEVVLLRVSGDLSTQVKAVELTPGVRGTNYTVNIDAPFANAGATLSNVYRTPESTEQDDSHLVTTSDAPGWTLKVTVRKKT